MGLAVTNLSCSRAGRPVLADVTFRLDDGAALLLRGPNGAGKSTLLRALAGLLPTSAGTVELGGEVPGPDDEAWSERVAYVGHLDAVKPQLTVAENLAFWADLLGSEATGPALAAFDLGRIADRPARFCSAGQKRRLGLARLLLAPRRLWLLDEPSAGLDEGSTARLLTAVRNHCAAGGLAVIATHAALELPAAPTLTLTPFADGAGDPSADPFLAERWA